MNEEQQIEVIEQLTTILDDLSVVGDGLLIIACANFWASKLLGIPRGEDRECAALVARLSCVLSDAVIYRGHKDLLIEAQTILSDSGHREALTELDAYPE